jgi:hypothetical protein
LVESSAQYTNEYSAGEASLYLSKYYVDCEAPPAPQQRSRVALLRIAQVALAVSNIEPSAQFYSKVLDCSA